MAKVMGLRRRRVLFVESLNLKALLPPDKIVQGITLAMERGLVETYGNDTIIEHANFTEFLTGCLGLKPLHGPTGVLAEVGRITGSTPNEQGFSTSVASLHVNGVISAVVFKDGAYHRRYLTPYSAQTIISFYSALNLLREKQKVMLGPHVLQMAEILRKTAGAEGECKHIGVFIRMLEAAIANDKSGFPIRSLRSNAQRVLREGEAKEVRAWALEAIKALLASLPAGNASSVFDPGPPAIGGKFKVLKFVSVKPPVIQITTSLREKQGRSTEMAVDKERQGSPAVTPSPSQVRMSNPVGSEREPPCGYADLQNPPIFSSPVPSNKLTATLIVRNRPATVTSRTNTGRRVTETIGTDFTFMFVSHVTIPPEDRFALARLLEEALQTTIPNTDKTGYVQHSGETLTNIAMTVFSLGKADRRGNIERLAKALVEHLNNNGHQVTLEFNK